MTEDISTDRIQGYHAHIYFDEATVETARAVLDACEARFDVERGRMHQRPVGPHPMGSCQLACAPDVFGALLPWLMLNRRGLTVFAHPETGDPVADHAERAIWLGASQPLNIDVIRRAVAKSSK